MFGLTVTVSIAEHVSGAERAEKPRERRGAVSGSRKKNDRTQRSAESRSGSGAVNGDHRNRLERGAPLTRSDAAECQNN